MEGTFWRLLQKFAPDFVWQSILFQILQSSFQVQKPTASFLEYLNYLEYCLRQLESSEYCNYLAHFPKPSPKQKKLSQKNFLYFFEKKFLYFGMNADQA